MSSSVDNCGEGRLGMRLFTLIMIQTLGGSWINYLRFSSSQVNTEKDGGALTISHEM